MFGFGKKEHTSTDGLMTLKIINGEDYSTPYVGKGAQQHLVVTEDEIAQGLLLYSEAPGHFFTKTNPLKP